ncbi:hypothetical protein, partial [Pseudomonas syringae group genomosp. 7]|uniref:hypothetical protein n=1 Tax=Pseudomonas syringae group genomosp. 7 TaxID=251699 RepID=UPI00376FB381
RFQAQSRAITQVSPLLDTDGIDKALPGLVDQYGYQKVFGGGVRTRPDKPAQGRNKYRSFIHQSLINISDPTRQAEISDAG